MKSFMAVVIALFAVLAAAIAQESDESLKGSEALYLAAPYATYGAYPYAAAPAAYGAIAAPAPHAAIPSPAAAPGAFPVFYYRR